ncbi:MAG: DUF4363 family protein [Eubacteriales bacterium]|nr:DUF4363 family protein [Eubacteriales bacterium]
MKRWVATICVLLLITAAVIWEQTYVNQTFQVLQDKVDALVVAIEACEDDKVDTDANKAQIADIETYWLKHERVLCYLVKHTETFQISDAISYAKNFIEFGNKEEVMSALHKLEYLGKVHSYNMGTSLENII